MPALVHDGVPIIDSSVICEYLDEVFPQNSTTATDALGRAKMRAWLRLHHCRRPPLRYPSFNQGAGQEPGRD